MPWHPGSVGRALGAAEGSLRVDDPRPALLSMERVPEVEGSTRTLIDKLEWFPIKSLVQCRTADSLAMSSQSVLISAGRMCGNATPSTIGTFSLPVSASTGSLAVATLSS